MASHPDHCADAGRVVVLEQGRVVEDGPPVELAVGDGPRPLVVAWSASR